MELVGIDIGATKIKTGRVVKGDIIKVATRYIDKSASTNKTVEVLIQCIDEVITSDTKRIGIGVPGVVDHLTGTVYYPQNLPAWEAIPLKFIIEQHYKLPVFINNDANCFAIGEKVFGIGKELKNFVGLTIGTGIGMGIIINHELYSGTMCGAGEIGMVNYRDSIIENYAGSFFFTRNYGASSKDLFDLAEKNDPSALEAFNEYGEHLGEVIKTILYLFAPPTIILGGSISLAYPYFVDALELSLKTFEHPKQIKDLNIEVSNKRESAILGAAALCLEGNVSIVNY